MADGRVRALIINLRGYNVKVTDLFKMTLLAGAIASSPVFAATDAPMTLEQKQAIEKVVHDYLVSNPEVLVEVSQVLQKKQQQDMQQQAKSAISENVTQLLDGKIAVAGNPKGDVTLVEFFDYQCIHCKKMKPVIGALIQKHGNLRVVYKEFPIFGAESEVASRAALAAGVQGKYVQMQEALLKIDKRLDKAIVMATAKSIGLNVDKLSKDMNSEAITKELADNRALAEKMHLMGTPAVVIIGTTDGHAKTDPSPAFIPGAATEEALAALIDKAGKA